MKPNNKYTFKVVAAFTFPTKMNLLKLICKVPIETTMNGTVIAVSILKVATNSVLLFVQTGGLNFVVSK